jgi:hypothetical protein
VNYDLKERIVIYQLNHAYPLLQTFLLLTLPRSLFLWLLFNLSRLSLPRLRSLLQPSRLLLYLLRLSLSRLRSLFQPSRLPLYLSRLSLPGLRSLLQPPRLPLYLLRLSLPQNWFLLYLLRLLSPLWSLFHLLWALLHLSFRTRFHTIIRIGMGNIMILLQFFTMTVEFRTANLALILP